MENDKEKSISVEKIIEESKYKYSQLKAINL